MSWIREGQGVDKHALCVSGSSGSCRTEGSADPQPVERREPLCHDHLVGKQLHRLHEGEILPAVPCPVCPSPASLLLCPHLSREQRKIPRESAMWLYSVTKCGQI